MASSTYDADPRVLATVRLGDIVGTPDGEVFSVRAALEVPADRGCRLRRLVMLGEHRRVVGVPRHVEAPYVTFSPSPTLPEWVMLGDELVSGAVAYWAAHLPGDAGGMGEIYWRLAAVRNAPDPLLVTFRSQEPTVWLPAGVLPVAGVRRLAAPATAVGSSEPTARRAAVVLDRWGRPTGGGELPPAPRA